MITLTAMLEEIRKMKVHDRKVFTLDHEPTAAELNKLRADLEEAVKDRQFAVRNMGTTVTVNCSEADILSRDWKVLREKVGKRWHSLDDQDLTLINGNRAVLITLLQEKYFYSKEAAEREVEQFLKDVAQGDRK